MGYYSPLRYPGGKGRLSFLMKEVLIENKICDCTYIEPYAGGAAVALTLLMEEFVWKIIINDIDPAIYAFWHCVLNETEWMLKRLNNTPVTMDEWYSQKAVFKRPEQHSINEIGFSAFFLNRTNRSGILKGGVIGGKRQIGKYKLNARFNKKDLSDRIKKIARRKNRIQLYNLDAGVFLKEVCQKIEGKVFFYFDPPYYDKGSLLYTNHYNHKDHAEISNIIKKIPYPWIVTYDNVPPITDMYSEIPMIRFSLTYSAHLNRPKATELMFFKGIHLPSYIKEMQMPYFLSNCISDLYPTA